MALDSAAGALSDGATLALFWNNERIAEPALRASMLQVFAHHAPSVVINDEPVTPERIWQRWPGKELADVDVRSTRPGVKRRRTRCPQGLA